MIGAKALSKSFGKQKVFENLNFAIKGHEFVSILGPSGCGKSTLLRIIAGLEQPSSGSLETEKSLHPSMIFQEARLLPWRTTLENTLLPLELIGQSPAPERARVLLRLLGIEKAERKFPHELSGGMKMRAAIARSLISDPKLILCDEPFSALDEPTRFVLQTVVRELFEKQKKNFIFVTHSLEEALFLSDRILVFTSSGLKEFRPNLPAERTLKLKEDIVFFNELSRLRGLQ